MTLDTRIHDLLECLDSQGIKTSWVPDDTFVTSVNTYLSLLHKWNATHDLVAPGSIEDFILPHILDSLASVLVLSHANLVPAFDRGQEFTFADIGSGAGLPGIPWHLWYGDVAKSYLVEPRRKRCSFLKMVVSELGLMQTEIVEGRSEALAVKATNVYAALFRALKPESTILKDFDCYKDLKIFWLAGPSTIPPEPWKKTAEYYLLETGEYGRVIYSLR